MWRRVCSQLSPWRYAAPGGGALHNCASPAASSPSSSSPSSFQKTAPLFSADSGNASLKRKVEDAMPIATGNERDEIEAELEGRKYGGASRSVWHQEDEHDVIWFWLEKGRPHECPVCSQYFVLEVTGAGGDPEAHSDDDHH